MTKKVSIIGAGLAGLSAGIYLQQNGIETEIFEMAGWAGGMCTTWVRKGYRFDGCIHWMVGTKPGDGFHELYKEVDALKEDTVIYNTDSLQMELNGTMYQVPMDLSKFKKFLYSISEQDSKMIDDLCKDIETFKNSQMPAGMPENLSQMFSLIKDSRGFLKISGKHIGKTVGEYAKRFQSPVIGELLVQLMPAEFSMAALIMMLGTRMGGNAGYPMGGSYDLIKRMETKYLSLGGKLNLNSKVDEILTDNGKAVGVKSKGVLRSSDAVIAACDAHDTLKRMLNGKYPHPQLDSMIKNAPLFPAVALVSFGLRKKFGIPYMVHYECPEGIEVAPGVISKSYSLRSFEFDPDSAPENCSSVMVLLDAPLEYWNKLRSENPEEYKNQKQKFADSVANAVEKRIPGFKDAIEVTDVATPATYVRLANLYQGSFEGFAPVPSSLKTNIKTKLPGLKRFCICGQWTTAGGGICSAIGSGKRAANTIMKELKK